MYKDHEEAWESDKEFGREYLAGQHACVIRAVRSKQELGQIPKHLDGKHRCPYILDG